MKFGYFDDLNREYVITTPMTPLPWINYLGSRDFFSILSNTSGGYSFYKDAKLLRITDTTVFPMTTTGSISISRTGTASGILPGSRQRLPLTAMNAATASATLSSLPQRMASQRT